MMDMLWQQWTQLGVLGHDSGEDSKLTLDPEALLVFSAFFGRYDQRLFDLMSDWLLSYHSLLNIPRLKSLQRKAKITDKAALGYLAAVCADRGDKRWKTLATQWASDDIEEPRLMFGDPFGESSTYVRSQDAAALRYGYIRHEYQPSGKVLRSLPQHQSTMLLTMRALVGGGARAEVLLLLWLTGGCRILELVRRSGYARSTIQEVLDELLIGNMVMVIPEGKCSMYYMLKQPEFFGALPGFLPTFFPNWQCWYDALGMLWLGISNPRFAKVSEITFRGEVARLLREIVHPAWFKSGLQAAFGEQKPFPRELFCDV